MRNILSTLLGLSLSLLLSFAAVASTIELTVVPSTVRVRQEGPLPRGIPAKLGCARREYESLQVVVTAREGNVERVTADVSALTDEAGTQLSPECTALFRVAYVPVRHSAPRATEAPGMTPDPLVPFMNPYSGDPIRPPRWRNNQLDGARFGGGEFNLWQDRHQPIWVDIFVPPETTPGDYTATLTVRAHNADPVDVSLSITVWDITLPEGPTHENHFGGFGRVAAYHGLGGDSDEYRTLEERYSAMMASHRINPPLPRHILPRPGEDGSVAFDAASDKAITAFVDRHHLTNVEIPRAPFGDVLGGDREKAIRFYQSWYEYLRSKGWANGAYVYMLDEPNTPEAYERVRQLGALVHEAEPRIRRLVVEQPYLQDPAWGPLDDAIDIWCPLFGFVHEDSVQRVQANGDEVWTYSALVQSAPPYHPEYEAVKGDNPPYWQTDFPLLSYRIAPWLNRRYGITGLLYWSTVYWGSPDRNPWDDPGFRIRWNGDGFLFYPGDDAGIEGPVASMRLKNLRDGMEDYEYFVLLEARGGKDLVDRTVREAVPTWGSWDQDPYRLLELRRQLAEAILAR
jgi:glycosyl hydrolase family 123